MGGRAYHEHHRTVKRSRSSTLKLNGFQMFQNAGKLKNRLLGKKPLIPNKTAQKAEIFQISPLICAISSSQVWSPEHPARCQTTKRSWKSHSSIFHFSGGYVGMIPFAGGQSPPGNDRIHYIFQLGISIHNTYHSLPLLLILASLSAMSASGNCQIIALFCGLLQPMQVQGFRSHPSSFCRSPFDSSFLLTRPQRSSSGFRGAFIFDMKSCNIHGT